MLTSLFAGCHIFLVCARGRAAADLGAARLPRAAHPRGHDHLRGQPEAAQLQPRLAPELGGGAGLELAARALLASNHLQASAQRGGVGQLGLLEAGGSQEQMRIAD